MVDPSGNQQGLHGDSSFNLYTRDTTLAGLVSTSALQAVGNASLSTIASQTAGPLLADGLVFGPYTASAVGVVADLANTGYGTVSFDFTAAGSRGSDPGGATNMAVTLRAL